MRLFAGAARLVERDARARTCVEVGNPAKMPRTKKAATIVEKLSKSLLTWSGGPAYKPPIETAPPLSGASTALHWNARL
jgi:hypothetical protein